MELRTPLIVPNHIKCQTREEANQRGLTGLCADDIRHFHTHCRTRFADFPGIDFGIQTTLGKSPDIILCQPSFYKTGTIAGQWQGSEIVSVSCFLCFSSCSYAFLSALIYKNTQSGALLVQFRATSLKIIEDHYISPWRSIIPVTLDPLSHLMTLEMGRGMPGSLLMYWLKRQT